ncbi:hypothetical protein [Capnocytophaga stomatis]|uniref:tRNA nuclease CdiA C-terminal domain-containing protein n=1 Tax=Capnocytophaga stomatis TaxID=1848904 RepID=A0ABW8QBT7_9FLAO|nr:hypothetical protein [Capnocytophaga stomatis]GIJ93825.1 hypothetical protein CAPN002_10430 [Capnocytophaga stomatis]
MDKVVVSVDDPMLKHYFPPNHFNCRTTVRQLRKGVPTESYAVPDIPDAFKNNPGITGKVFTQKNSYIVNTPSDVLVLAPSLYKENERNKRYEGIDFEAHKIGKGVVEIYKHETLKDKQRKQRGNEFAKNKNALTILAERGEKYRMLPIVDDDGANPDAINLKTLKYVDIKVAESSNGKNIVQSAFKEASGQGEDLIIRLLNTPNSYRDMYLGLITTLKAGRAKDVKKVIVIFPNGTVKQYDIDKVRDKITKGQIS